MNNEKGIALEITEIAHGTQQSQHTAYASVAESSLKPLLRQVRVAFQFEL